MDMLPVMGDEKDSSTKINQSDVENSLKQEIIHLQKQLEDQFLVRSALERALTNNKPLSHDPTSEKTSDTYKPAEDLIKEIAVLELEVVYLEKYLLSMYRKTFQSKFEDSSVKHGSPKTKSSHFFSYHETCDDSFKETGNVSGRMTLADSSIHRSHSSLSHRSFRAPPIRALAETVDLYHSLPLSMLEQCHGSTSLAEHLSTGMPNYILETPNLLSEEMIKCISAVYCELADPPLTIHGFPSSPISFSSSSNDSSPLSQHDMQLPKSKEFGGAFGAVIEVTWISRDSQRLRHVKHMLEHFRSIVSRLEEVDPRKMRHEEKLAFWINVHNALVMHAFLVYGIPQNSLKRVSLLLKAAYNIGGHHISVDMIQNSILGCRLPRPGQWLHSLFFPKTKFKARDARKEYAINHPEPRLYFAVCSGSSSDPVVRMYTPKGVYQELEAAKEDYIQNALRAQKGHKLLLPKILDYFAKDSCLCPVGLMDTIEQFIPTDLRKGFRQNQNGKLWKRIEWLPHNFTLRYLLSQELVQ